jgi:DNA-binding transcriptional MerR regulator
MKAHNFSKIVRQHSKRIVTDSHFRAPPPKADEKASGFNRPLGVLRSLIRRLPQPVQATLKSLVGEDADLEHMRQLLRQANAHRAELNEREHLLERQIHDVQSERKSLQELKLNLRARLKSQPDVVSVPAVGQIVRMPITKVVFDLDQAPRPPSDINRLAQNLKRFGQQTPVVCFEREGAYHLISGYRRMVALTEAEFTHVNVQVTPELDPETAAALYIAENCLVRGVSLSEVRRLEALVHQRQGFSGPIQVLIEDDDTLEEDMTLAEVAEETRHHLSEAAAWIAALRPHWQTLDPNQRTSLVSLIRYLAQVAKLRV